MNGMKVLIDSIKGVADGVDDMAVLLQTIASAVLYLLGADDWSVSDDEQLTLTAGRLKAAIAKNRRNPRR